ncbi:hypothetical protein QCA50_009842 [Cerrena zonata]|uniref:Nuclear pore complex protein Nup85 n=1 Tax=Cerrena zonata TaxID=2478898 RepID=A0AAW0G277_9APHY
MPSLAPPLFELGHAEEFASSGRTLATAFSPRDESLAVYATNNVDPQSSQRTYPDVQPVYFASPQAAPVAERRTFISDTSVVFELVQNLSMVSQQENSNAFRVDDRPNVIRKLAYDYVNHTKEVWVYVTREIAKGQPRQYTPDHYRILYSCFSLFTLLYAPGTEAERIPVGEDLMEWLNTHYVEPSSEEGIQLSAQDEPWQNEAFWPYITRATVRGLSKATAFFLDILASKHPSPHLQRLSKSLAPLLTGHPRIQQFTAERDFAIASRRWKEKTKTLRLELDRIPEEARDDGFENWWDRISDIVGILEGRGEVIKRICEEVGADWKEVTAVWGVYVDGRLRRAELPDVVTAILDDMPSDPTDLEDAIQSSLLLGKPIQALSYAAQFDVWLAAHMADLMQALGLIENETTDSDIPLRDYYVLQYAEYMRLDPSCWRHTVSYLCTCGTVGHEMADQVLMRVALRLQTPKDSQTANEESARIRAGILDGVLKEVNATCFEHQREAVRRMVCRIAAQTFLREKNYGLAISYCASAEDWPGMGRIVDRVLDEYIINGPASFAHTVANIAPTLQSLRSQNGNNLNGVFIHRLRFAVRFAEFHQRRLNGELEDAALDVMDIFQEEIVPTSWWAVVLCDTLDLLRNNERFYFASEDAYLLMRKVEEIALQTTHGSGSDYLAILARTIKNGDEKLALQRVQMVRLALTRYYARCGVIDVGGKMSVFSK